MKPYLQAFPKTIALAMIACTLPLYAQAQSANRDPRATAAADETNNPLLRQFAEECINSLEGRDWLLVDPAIVPMLRELSRQRQLDLKPIPVVASPAAGEEWLEAVDALNNETLAAAADLGAIAFFRAWLKEDPDRAARHLATMLLPDLFADTGLRAIPNGVLFIGAEPGAITPESLDRGLQRHRELWDKAAEEWILPATQTQTDGELLMTVRRQLGWAANELGALFLEAERNTEALEIFTRARAMDPQNVSAMLNRAVAVKRGARPELAETIARELEGLGENLPDSRILWRLTQVYGTVVSPADFLPLGWVWALSGVSLRNSELANALIPQIPEEHQAAVSQQLKSVFAGQTGATDTAMQLLERLKDPDQRPGALMAMAQRTAAKGQNERSEHWFRTAAAEGLPAEDIIRSRAGGLMVAGKTDEARAILEKAVAENPEYLKCRSMLLQLYADIGDADALEKAIAEAESKGTPELETKIARARLLTMQGKTGLARELLNQLTTEHPGQAALYDLLLPLDFRMGDKRAAADHADKLLEIVPTHAFANYIKGSLHLERKEYEEAERHFRQSLAGGQTLYALNDLAALLLETGRPSEAELTARAALRINSSLAAPWETLASALEALGKEEDAYQAMREATGCADADDPRIQLHWARILQKRGETAKAVKAADAAHEKRMQLDAEQRGELIRLRDSLR